MTTAVAVPGEALPGFILPGLVQAASAPSGPPVVFSIGPSRHLWTVVRARNSGGAGMILTQPAVSLQAIQVNVSAIQDGAAYDPSADPVAMAFVVNPNYGSPGAPAASSGAWNAATWETDSSGGLTQYWASFTVGPGGTLTLTAGTAYTVFLKIISASSGEVPILTGPGLLIT